MRRVNIHEAKTHLSRLLAAVSKGEEIEIARYGEPIARLVPVQTRKAARRPGSARGEFRLTASFFEPLGVEVLEGFEG